MRSSPAALDSELAKSAADDAPDDARSDRVMRRIQSDKEVSTFTAWSAVQNIVQDCVADFVHERILSSTASFPAIDHERF
jgi:hypothetical protein